MDKEEFRKYAHQMVDWMADYMDGVGEYPVKSQVKPKEIYNQLPTTAPTAGETMAAIFQDFEDIIVPGITHWQSPTYFAYFTANTSPPSILAEMLTATMAAQCMKWDTSPAAAELEERVMEWLMQAMGMPEGWTGVIQDTASTATLAAILTAREQKSKRGVNTHGYTGEERYRVYCSAETHSSIEKGAKIAGIGKENVVKVTTDDALSMRADSLREAIADDVKKGYTPLCVVAAIGTTGTTAIDPLDEIGDICQEYDIWLHVDAAFAGSAAILPEMQWMHKGVEKADSYVFNPHKWLFTNFDCTAYFVKDPKALVDTFAILPEYLRTQYDGQVNNYCDWGVPLGRRFRALKLWFVIRSYGIDGLRAKIRHHIDLAEWLETEISESDDFEMLAPRPLNLVCFRYHPDGLREEQLNALNEKLVAQLNATGKLYLTHTKVNGKYTLRIVIGQTNVEKHHVESSWELIKSMAKEF